jgi:hypothetical protein
MSLACSKREGEKQEERREALRKRLMYQISELGARRRISPLGQLKNAACGYAWTLREDISEIPHFENKR